MPNESMMAGLLGGYCWGTFTCRGSERNTTHCSDQWMPLECLALDPPSRVEGVSYSSDPWLD